MVSGLRGPGSGHCGSRWRRHVRPERARRERGRPRVRTPKGLPARVFRRLGIGPTGSRLQAGLDQRPVVERKPRSWHSHHLHWLKQPEVLQQPWNSSDRIAPLSRADAPFLPLVGSPAIEHPRYDYERASDQPLWCAPGGIRTPDPRIRSPTLYPLSYGRKVPSLATLLA